MSISPVVKGVDEIKELTLKFGNAASATTKPPLLFNQNSEQAFIDKSLQWDFRVSCNDSPLWFNLEKAIPKYLTFSVTSQWPVVIDHVSLKVSCKALKNINGNCWGTWAGGRQGRASSACSPSLSQCRDQCSVGCIRPQPAVMMMITMTEMTAKQATSFSDWKLSFSSAIASSTSLLRSSLCNVLHHHLHF